ncbi:MAG: hypothetical protein V2I67_01485 [Thermoanaerobaculales bacterium]|nr:hypothetical protein [Thermoanaerobaculales bacterium]
MATNGDNEGRGWLRLWGLADRRLDLVLTVLAAAGLALSRFALLASGPWEWDETIFARGMLDFSLAAHFPHPPGFPGLLALGHLLMPLAGTPYAALQLVSAVASVLMLWPLAILGRRVAPPAVAAAAALLVLFLPGPWLYSVRGFSTMAAVAPLLAAAALLTAGLGGRRATGFTLLLTASFLIRPILLPTVALVWLAGAETVRPRRRLIAGIALGVAAIAVATLVMVRLEGGWADFVEPFRAHADFHAARLHRNTQVVAELGLVKGVGGLAVSAALGALSLIGLGVWWRKTGARAASVWAVVLVLTIAQLLMLQNRSYARYAVGVQLAAAPLVAGAASLAPAPVAAVVLLGLAGSSAVSSFPLLREQHHETFGAWQATLDGADRAAERDWAVIVEPEIHVFSSYWWSVLESRGEAAPPMILTPRAPEPWTGVDRPWVVATVHPHLYWPSLVGVRTDYGGVSDRLRPLTQDRFLAAAVIDNPPLPVGRWWSVERVEDGRPFMWGGPEAELWLPPSPAGTLIGLELRPAPGDAPLTVEVSHGAVRMEIDGRSGVQRLWFRTEIGSVDQPVIVRLHRAQGYPPAGDDERPLAVQLFDVVVRPPGSVWGGSVVDAERLRLELGGAFPVEDLGGLGPGAWLRPRATLGLLVNEPGLLHLRLASPRPTPARPTVVVENGAVVGPVDVGHRGSVVTVRVDEDAVEDKVVELELVSDPYHPWAEGSPDTRELGIVLLGLEFEPARPTEGWWSVPVHR